MDNERRTRATARVRDIAKAKGRSPHPRWSAAATEAGSGAAAAAAAALDTSNLWAQAAALTGDGGSIRWCQHVLCEQAVIDVGIELIKTSVDGPMCNAYKCGATEGRNILVCLGCESSFCTGHAIWHARMNQHWVALMYKRPNVAHCFACEDSYFIRSEKPLGAMATVKDDSSIGTIKKDEKGMAIDNEAGGHASAAKEADSGGGDMAVLTNDATPQQCKHAYKRGDIVRVTKRILSRDIAPMCSDSACDTFEGSLILVCLGCEKAFCAEHAGMHAKNTKHWNYLIYQNPHVVSCFVCKGIVFLSVGVDKKEKLADNATADHASGSVIGHAHAIKGIPNLGNTCYLNALLQCLLVLGRLRARMLGLDAPPTGTLGLVLRDLFKDTGSVNNGGDLLDPKNLLKCVQILHPQFRGTCMQDSHEMLCCLRNGLDMEESIMTPSNMQDGDPSAVAPTVFHSIFGGQLSVTKFCKCCSFHSVSHDAFYDLSVPLPEKALAKRVEPPWSTKGLRSQRKRNTEKIHRIAEDGDSQSVALELEDVFLVKRSEPLKVDSTKVEQILQSNDAIHGHFQTHKDKVQGKAVDVLSQKVLYDAATEDSCIPEDLASPPFVSPLREENPLIASGSDVEKNDSTVQPEVSTEAKITTCSVKITSKDKGKVHSSHILYDKVQGINSVASIEECLELHFEAAMMEWTCENCSKVAQKPGNIIGSSECQVEEKQNEQMDRKKGTVQTRLSKLPPVLVIHLKRNLGPHKVIGHVSFQKVLDVGLFMDPSSEDKYNSSYRLVGIIEHQGLGKDAGHFVAYVRKGRPQQSNGSSLWFRASDTKIRKISLEEVLKCEAYLLFYERIEG